MPAIRCSNGKWKWGEKGPCTFDSKEEAERVGHIIEEKKMLEDKLKNIKK